MEFEKIMTSSSITIPCIALKLGTFTNHPKINSPAKNLAEFDKSCLFYRTRSKMPFSGKFEIIDDVVI